MQRSIDSDFEDENEICYTSKRRAQAIPQHFDDDSLPSSSWTNPEVEEEDQRSSSIDYYHPERDDIDDEIFNLPSSSNDLSVTPQQALHLATIYEFLRHFSPILRLSPFLFEHFCTSVIQSIDINNKLFSQIHICLLRLLIKQDDDDGITYASETDIKGIIDLSFVTMDYITWPYILQLYVNSHPQLKILSNIIKEYPFKTNIEEKIDVLLALCDVVVTTKTIRREFDDTKPKQHDDNCRQCQKRGDLLCCDRCEATYHLTCLNPPLTSVPTVEWFCPVCVQNEIHGVSDCIPPRENRPFYLRHRCIGHDREQRRYWFVCRRLFV
jgi:nucleosome-remodeling factor subunit BPTF